MSTWASWESLGSWSRVSNIIRSCRIRKVIFNLIQRRCRRFSRGAQRGEQARRSSLSSTWSNGSSCGHRWSVAWNRINNIIHIRPIKLRNLSNLCNARPRWHQHKRKVEEQRHKFPSSWPKARCKANGFWSETSRKAIQVDLLKYQNDHADPKSKRKKSIMKAIWS